MGAVWPSEAAEEHHKADKRAGRLATQSVQRAPQRSPLGAEWPSETAEERPKSDKEQPKVSKVRPKVANNAPSTAKY